MGWQDAPVVEEGGGEAWRSAPPSTPKAEQVTPTTAEKALAMYVSPVETALHLGSGAVASILGGLTGLGAAAMPGLPEGAGARTSEAIQDALTFEPRNPYAKKLSGAIAAPFEYLATKADKAGGATTDITGSPLLGTAVNTGIQSLPMVAGKVMPKGVKPTLPKEPSPLVSSTREAGYKLTPTEGEHGVLSRTAAGLAGETKLGKSISADNYRLATEKIAKDLGIKDGVLDYEALEGVRLNNGKAYEALKNAGEVVTDEKYRADLHAIVADQESTASAYAHRADSPILKTVESLLSKDRVDAAVDVAEIKLLRNDAKKAYRAGDGELGGAYLDIAKAIEDKLDRHVSAPVMGSDGAGIPGNEAAMAAFRHARQQIAKSYEVQKALRGDVVDPQVYATLHRNRAPLSGAAKELGEAASQFPESFKSPRVAKSGGGSGTPTATDAVLASLKAGGSGLGKAAASLFVRPTVRSVLGSEWYQSIPRAPLRTALSNEAVGNALGYGSLGGIALPEEKR